MQPTPYPDLNDVLREFCTQLSVILGNDIVGVYLHGSLAIGDFSESDSDADFLVVIERELTTAQVAKLKEMHASILALPSRFAKLLEGSYLPKNLLNKPENVGVIPLWYLDHGTGMVSQAVYDNSWAVLWVLHHYGIAVLGPPPKSLFGPVAEMSLRQEALAFMKSWKNLLLGKPESINSVWNQSFIVLSYCRMLQTLETGTVHSKLASVRWSETAMGDRWHSLVSRAWLGRQNPNQMGRRPPAISEVNETLAFIEYVVGVRAAGFNQ